MKTKHIIISTFLLITQLLFSQTKSLPFFDGFDNNKNNWIEGNNTTRHLYVTNGSYHFEYKKSKGGWESYKSVNISTSKDFKIETLSIKKSGVLNYGYGLIFGGDANGNIYIFNITGNGYYRIAKNENGSFTNLVKWTKSSAIKQGTTGKYNVLRIEKIGEKIYFKINNITVSSLDFEPFFGKRIGFIVYRKQHIQFNYISVGYLTKSKPKPVVNNYKQEYIPFFDGFNNNKYNWSLKNSSETKIDITGGNLNFNHALSSGYDEVHKSFNLKDYKNFVINTSFYKKSGVNGYGYGIYWGSSDMDNRYTFLIAGNGEYAIYKKVKGKIFYLQNWSNSSNINKGIGQTNILSIEKVGSNYQFYINSKLVKTLPFEPFLGNKVGYLVFSKQQIDVHYLSIYYSKTIKPKPNVIVNNNNYQKDVFFLDDFVSNANNWAITNNENASLNINNGFYNFKHKRDKFGWTTTKEIIIDEYKDFEIEADIKKVAGIKNNGYGIIWGRKDSDNQFQFFISADGYYYVRYFDNGKINIIKKWTKSNYINKGDKVYNKLKIRKEGNVYKYYINNNYVFQSNAKPFYGNRVGFLIYGRQSIAINSLNVNYITKKDVVSDFLFYDNFNKNENKWATGNKDSYNLNISAGKYFFNHKRKTGGWSTSIEKYIDQNKDYEIEAKILKISGIKNNGFGIIWGRKSPGNTFEFDIASNGLYFVSRSVNSKRDNLINWTTSSYVKQGNNTYNTLKIKKQGDIMKFYINGNYVNQILNKPFLGNRIGFILYQNQKIAIDYLKIRYLKSTLNPVVVTNTKKGLINDNFDNNANFWATGDTKNYYLGINSGKYYFAHKNTTGGWSSTLKTKIDQTRNFEITAEIKKISGVNNYGYGLTWGRKDTNNQYIYTISGSGYYKIRKLKQGNSMLLQDWKKSNYINKGNNATNVLTIRKNNNTLNFYINNNFVASKEFTPFYGNKLGFIIYANQKISINKINVKYLKTNIKNIPPTIVIYEPAVTRGFKIVKAKRITVKGKATDADGVYEVTVNGIDASLQADGSFVTQIPLRVGDNNLNVKATDLKYNSSITKFKIKREVKPVVIVDPNIDNNNIKKKEINTNGGTYYAILIGVSDYNDSKIISLDGMPTNDIHNLGDALVSYYTFDKNNVETLSNPTRSQIIRAFDRLKKKVTPKDNLLIFYAGHGTFVKEDNIGYWLPADAEAEYTDNWINNTIVRDNIKRIKSKHTLLISDACFSGSIFKTRAFSIKNAKLSIQKKYELPSRKAMTSGTLKTVPNISVFMKYLLDRLENNKDPYLSASQLFSRIELPVGNNSPNTPQYGTIQGVGDEGGDFIFIRKN